MKNKLYGFSLQLDVYSTHINVLFGCKKALKDWVETKEKDSLIDFEKDFDGVTFLLKNNTYIFLEKPKDTHIFAHELVHALYKELYPRNLPFDYDNNEVFAYSMGYCIEKYIESVKKKDYFLLDKNNKWKAVKK